MLWYSLEAPHRGTSYEYPQHMFSWRYKNNTDLIPLLIRNYIYMLKNGSNSFSEPDLRAFAKFLLGSTSKYFLNQIFLSSCRAHDKTHFPSEKYRYFSYFCMKTYVVDTHYASARCFASNEYPKHMFLCGNKN